ncbi:MFS transporter [Streptomyces sp. SCSIO 30461]|uniref:MFS transporter n=1 Tax=Streptomyces sp. SCSIO 30461 TaxID=3118085 RepID=UPI0030D22208
MWKPRAGFNRNFRLLWFSVVVSGLGDGLRYVAFPLLASSMTSDPRKIALVFLADQLPWPLAMIAAGVTADRFDRRRIMITLDVARVALVAALAVVVGLGRATLVWIFLVTALMDLGQRFYIGAAAGLVPMTVPVSRRDKGNAAVQGGSVTATLLVGNPLGAILFDMHPVLPFCLDALSFLCSAILLFSMRGRYHATRSPSRARLSRRMLRRDITDGLHALGSEPLLRRITALSTLYYLVGMSQIAVSILYTRNELGLSDTGYGLMVATFGAGALIGSVLVGRLAHRAGRGRFLLWALYAAVVASLGIGLSDTWWQAATFVLLAGASSTVWRVTATTMLQIMVPGHLLGRATMTQKLLVRCGAAVGAGLGGIVAHHLGLRWVIYAGATLLLAGTIAGGHRFETASATRGPGSEPDGPAAP